MMDDIQFGDMIDEFVKTGEFARAIELVMDAGCSRTRRERLLGEIREAKRLARLEELAEQSRLRFLALPS